jgi:hypothetical protein
MNTLIKAFAVCAAIALTASGSAFAHDEAVELPLAGQALQANAAAATGRAPALLSYDQAKARGFDVDSAKRSGLPACPSVPYLDKGITSEDDAEAIAIMQNRESAPRCYSPVRNMQFGVGAPPPHPGSQIAGYPNSYYHWTGWNTYGHNHWGEGVQYQIEVADPSVTSYSNGYEFVSARVMLVNEEYDWTEAGWYEYNYFTGNNQCVYGFGTPESVHHFDCSSYPLSVGSMYTFRTEQLSENGEYGVGGFVYYGGVWRLLVYNDQMFCTTLVANPYCFMDIALEVETDVDPNRHVVLNGDDYDGLGVTFHLGQVKKIGDDSWNSVSSYNNCANIHINNDSPDYRMLKRSTLDIRNSFRVAKTGNTYDDCP